MSCVAAALSLLWQRRTLEACACVGGRFIENLNIFMECVDFACNFPTKPYCETIIVRTDVISTNSSLPNCDQPPAKHVDFKSVEFSIATQRQLHLQCCWIVCSTCTGGYIKLHQCLSFRAYVCLDCAALVQSAVCSVWPILNIWHVISV